MIPLKDSRTRRAIILTVLLVLVLGSRLLLGPHQDPAIRDALPFRLNDAEFWTMVSNFSEQGGYFRSDNFVSNESAFQEIIPSLKKTIPEGGVYVGVGPDQNFTYITALKPKMAFVVDIRRQNMLLHLMYKAALELSSNRLDFLTLLFSRRKPEGLLTDASVAEMLRAVRKAESPDELFQANLERILDHLSTGHHFNLTPEDCQGIHYVYSAFRAGGPDIQYSSSSPHSLNRFPSYSDLILEDDRTGVRHSYLASEENFQYLRQMELGNRIVPIVGNFAGGKALRSIARYLKDHETALQAFYTSNVEFYLFQSDDWQKFYDNIGQMPVRNTSAIIRSFFINSGAGTHFQGKDHASAAHADSMVEPVRDLTSAFSAGKIHTYYDVIERSK